MQSTTARPMGVTIIAVLSIIGGLLGIFGSLVVLGIGGLAATVDGGVGALAIILGILLLALSVGQLVFGIGAWMLKPWAWMLGIGIFALSIIVSIITGLVNNNIGGQILSVVIDGIIIYYLMTPEVKRAFGQA